MPGATAARATRNSARLAGSAARSLVLLLPGMGMAPQEFAAQGFDEAVQARGLALDVQPFDAWQTGYHDPQVPQRLRQAVQTARADYAQVWLAGISLGGHLAMAYAADHADATADPTAAAAEPSAAVDGLCLLSAYPGSRPVWNTIAAAGGLSHWQASAAQLRDAEYRVWHWWRTPQTRPALWWGHGRQDRFADGMARMAACCPPGTVHVVEGGHDWAVWRTLWQRFLDQWPARTARMA